MPKKEVAFFKSVFFSAKKALIGWKKPARQKAAFFRAYKKRVSVF